MLKIWVEREILSGQFPQHTFDNIISSASVVLMPYEEGAQSGVMAHCFAFKKPVIASALPAFKKTIEASGGGVICNNEKEFIDKTIELLNNSKKLQSLARNIENYISQKVGWSLVAEKHIEIYHSVITMPYGRARYVYVDP